MLFSKEYLPINFIFIKKILNSITHLPVDFLLLSNYKK